MDKYAWAHNRIRKLARLMRQRKLLKRAGINPYLLGGGIGTAVGGGLGALIGGKNHRALGTGIGAGTGLGLGLLGAYLSQNPLGNSPTGTTSIPNNPPASKPAPDTPSNPKTTPAAQTMSTPAGSTKPNVSVLNTAHGMPVDVTATDLDDLGYDIDAALDIDPETGESVAPPPTSDNSEPLLKDWDKPSEVYPNMGYFGPDGSIPGEKLTQDALRYTKDRTSELARAIDLNNQAGTERIEYDYDPVSHKYHPRVVIDDHGLSNKIDDWREALKLNTPQNRTMEYIGDNLDDASSVGEEIVEVLRELDDPEWQGDYWENQWGRMGEGLSNTIDTFDRGIGQIVNGLRSRFNRK